jgi:hypothetical protein
VPRRSSGFIGRVGVLYVHAASATGCRSQRGRRHLGFLQSPSDGRGCTGLWRFAGLRLDPLQNSRSRMGSYLALGLDDMPTAENAAGLQTKSNAAGVANLTKVRVAHMRCI